MLYPAELRVHLVGIVCVEERVGQTDSIMLPLREAKVNHLSIEECIQNANKSALDFLTKNNYKGD